MKCLGAMLFKEQARLFVQLIISKAPSPIFVSWYFPKKELTSILIHVHKVIKCLLNAVVNVPRNCWEPWKQLIWNNFQNSTLEVITITVTQIVLIQVFFLPLLLNRKIKMKTRNTMAPSHHSKISSTQNQEVQFFLLFGSWSLVLYLYVWVKSKFYW